MNDTSVPSQASPRPWSISPIASEGMYANDGAVAILNEDNRIAMVDCQAAYKRGQGYLAKCAERDANAALIVRAVNSHDALVKSLREMIECYWGAGDGIEPPPHIITAAYEALKSAEASS